MKTNGNTMIFFKEEIGERLNFWGCMFCDTLLGSTSTHNKFTVYYTDGGRIEVTFNKGKELKYVKFDSNNERTDACTTKSIGFISEKLTGYTYWNKCEVDRIEMLYF